MPAPWMSVDGFLAMRSGAAAMVLPAYAWPPRRAIGQSAPSRMRMRLLDARRGSVPRGAETVIMDHPITILFVWQRGWARGENADAAAMSARRRIDRL